MLKKIYGMNSCGGRVGLGLAGLCLLLAGAGHCAKNEPDPSESGTNKPDSRKQGPLDDPEAAAAMAAKFSPEEKKLRELQMEQLKAFTAAKEKQAETLATGAGEDISPEARRLFDAAKRGDSVKMREMFESFMKRHMQYRASSGDKPPDASYWEIVADVNLGYECVVPMDPKSVQSFVDDTINSIPPGSIYFGGTDSGRGLITAFSKSHADADPFFTLTQNQLADSDYLTYVRRMYGAKIYVPTEEDASKCLEEYSRDAKARYEHDMKHPDEPRQIKPGEEVRMVNGWPRFSGQVAVMAINGLLVKVIFDHNPSKEFYIEESFPLDWMYPYLEPHEPIMKLNRDTVEELPSALVAKDREYWQKQVDEKLGSWLTGETSVASVVKFEEKVFGRKDLSGFSGDERYIESDFAQKMFSKLRSSIGGLYDWRSEHAKSSVERERMAKEADLAFRQAFALCPNSPEATYRYVRLLVRTDRIEDAILVASTASKLEPENQGVANLVEQLKRMRKK